MVGLAEEQMKKVSTPRAAEKPKTTGSEVSVADAVSAKSVEIPRFAKRAKTRSSEQLVLGLPASQKLLTSQPRQSKTN